MLLSCLLFQGVYPSIPAGLPFGRPLRSGPVCSLYGVSFLHRLPVFAFHVTDGLGGRSPPRLSLSVYWLNCFLLQRMDLALWPNRIVISLPVYQII